MTTLRRFRRLSFTLLLPMACLLAPTSSRRVLADPQYL